MMLASYLTTTKTNTFENQKRRQIATVKSFVEIFYVKNLTKSTYLNRSRIDVEFMPADEYGREAYDFLKREIPRNNYKKWYVIYDWYNKRLGIV